MKTFRPGRGAALAMIGAAFLSSGCTRIVDRQGYVLNETLANAIQPGIDNRESVEGTLGRPTFVGQFDQRDWYYVTRETRQLAFAMPSPQSQTVLRIRFDEAGNVVAVDRSGLEKVASISPTDDKTPTLGRKRGILQEIFGGIGQVGGVGAEGQTADNPR